MRWLGTDNERVILTELRRYLPNYYYDCRSANGMCIADAYELELYHERLRSVLDQYFIMTATYELVRWERLLGLPVGGDVNNITELEARRSAIISKMQGYGTVTADKLKELAISYEGGIVDVFEVPSEYKIIIKFISVGGIPVNLPTLQKIIREAVPAHLNVEYEFSYLTWETLNGRGQTWAEFDAMNYNWETLSVDI